jgi:hypothetical protein
MDGLRVNQALSRVALFLPDARQASLPYIMSVADGWPGGSASEPALVIQRRLFPISLRLLSRRPALSPLGA